MSFTQNEIRILERVTARLKEKSGDSLEAYFQLPKGLGMETWFKVETDTAIKAMIDKGSKIRVSNKDVDLTIVVEGEQKQIELKAHNSDSFSWIKSWRDKYPNALGLFLMEKGENLQKALKHAEEEGFLVKTKDVASNWITGLLKLRNPKKNFPT